MKWLILFLVASCAQVTSLNLRKHQFGILPTRIIWFQVAGFEEEQIAMLRFQQSADVRTSFEQSICVGQSWSFNSYLLRTPAELSFLAQLTGKKNVKGTCEDAELKPIWNYINPNGYQTGILESGARPEQSLTKFSRCGEKGAAFLNSLYYYVRGEPVRGARTFHYSDTIPTAQNEVLYDRTCSAAACGSTITEDFKAIYEVFRFTSRKHVFIIRDFSYLKALQNKEFQKAREILMDIERAYREALKLAESSDYLVMLTSGESKFVDMPDQGKGWNQLEREGKGVSTSRTKLTNLVLASGARAENFCGIYEDTNVFERILSGPQQQGLELQIINPFK